MLNQLQLLRRRLHPRRLHLHPRRPTTPLSQLPSPLARKVPKPPCHRSNPHRSPRAHPLLTQCRRAHLSHTTRPRLLRWFSMTLLRAPLHNRPHKVLRVSLKVLPHLLQMPPLPELVLSSTTALAILRFASYKSGRAGRSVAHVKTLSVRRRFQTEATAFTLCTAAGIAKERKAATALTSPLPLLLMKVGIIPTGSGTLSGTPTLGHPLGAHKTAGKKAGTKGGISDQPRFGSAVKIRVRIDSRNCARHRFLFVPALQDLGTASPLQVQKRVRFPSFGHRCHQCCALLCNILLVWGSRFSSVCSAGEGLPRFIERCPRLISDPASDVSPDPHCFPTLRHSSLRGRPDTCWHCLFLDSPALLGTYGRRVLLSDERVQHPR